MRSALHRLVAQEDLNFLLTNRLPRRLTTRFMGWFSKIENPVVRRTSIAAWKLFTDLDLSEAATTRFRSIHDVFTRQLKPGARPADPRPGILASPCDGIVGACGRIDGDHLYQIKGFPYTLKDLLGDEADGGTFRNGRFVTIRLTSSDYHRFHAPHDLVVDGVTYISGDTWNVNPIALKRVEKLFCKNERALVHCRLQPSGHPIMLVPVAAILVASIRFHFCDTVRHVRARHEINRRRRVGGLARAMRSRRRGGGAKLGVVHRIPCLADVAKGEEMGWFEHGSTIILFAPDGFDLAEDIGEGTRIKAGQALMRLPAKGRLEAAG
ncbi:MAG: phosphatidylserine decarboxylase [Alphaproteobacteria bacterium]|nr:phosphatidylserine decarboxylase [Alphaproteobacteria bacterium]